MWLRKGERVVSVPAHMPETIARCLGEGWAEIPDPTIAPVVAAPDTEPVPAPAQPQPARPPVGRHQSGNQRGRR